MSVVLVCAALAGFVLLYTLWVPRQEIHVPQPPTRLDHLQEKKKVLYDNLKDLHFEYRTGKFSDEDYKQLKTSLQYELALVMKQIEEIETRRETAGKRKAADTAEPAVETASGGEAPVCPSCGHPNPAQHKHCSECGARLQMLVVLLLLAGVSIAALPAVAEQVAVEGVVRNGTTGNPASGALVALIRAGESKESLEQVVSGRGGRFHFQPVDLPAPPAMLLVQVEHGGVRYTEPTVGTAPVELAIYEAGAPASAIRVAERAVILHPTGGKLLVNEFYRLWNGSEPPATYAPAGSTFRFFVPEGGSRSVQVTLQGAAGMSIPLEPRPYAAQSGVLAVSHPLKPGENRIGVSYHLDYPGSLEFASRAVEEVERTLVAVPEGVTLEGEGLSELGSEPETGFEIHELARNDRWTVRLAGEGRPASGATGEGSGAAENDSDVVSRLGPVGEKRALLLAVVMAALGMGFLRLWRQQKPVTLPRQVARGGPPSRKRRS